MHLSLVLALALFGQEAPEEQSFDPFAGIEWVEGPAEAKLGNRATIDVPAGMRFTGARGTRQVLEASGNPTSGTELGLVLSEGEEAGATFFVVFDFDDSGYVEDEDKDELDAGDLLTALRAGNDQANDMRRSRGWDTIELVGWKREPFYDPRTNNLTWATLGRSPDGDSVNWSVRVLGRRGVMSVDLVLGPEDLDAALPSFESIMSSFEYSNGERYAQFTDGDKVADYGLAALVLGGGTALAAKTGLLAKFWKVLLVGLAAVAAGIKKGFNWLRGRNGSEEERPAQSS